ncbi:hypothetical protein ALC60_02539 [Trachymyrmex zeteki]|uniref:Uncharacterized protein n=1 Tax=Mycetomoellerius zeteki TaxID=64791 RepID=A0A151XDQ4_9HYME|nr:hypothetical protein ALC60_02539 [Trachymyrmex zeteki]
MTGNPINVRRGRIVLSDLDQIKKNERDRRRRLRLEQVRQQSKEISNRLLERAKKIAREELSKLEKNGKSELKQMHDRKIMDIQRKYQEDLEDIGQAHASAALQPDANTIIKEEGKKDRVMALKRGKDAMECMKETKWIDDAEAARLQKKSFVQSPELFLRKKVDKYTSDHIKDIIDDVSDDQIPRTTVPSMSIISTKSDKIKYNPANYTHNTSDNTSSVSSSNNSSSTSDDSSYFSDAIEQITCKTPKTPALTENKVQSQCDRTMYQRYIYDRPLPMVERIDIRNEPSAMEVAQVMKNAENRETHISKSHKLSAEHRAERRGEDAILREKVRRDYQALLQNLNHLAQEERKLKASQIQSTEEDTCMRLHQKNKCQEERKKKLNRAAKKICSTDSYVPTRHTHLTERIITLPVQKKDGLHDDVPHCTWEDPHLIKQQVDVCHTQRDKDSEMSREEQVLDMLKKIERQKRLLLQEFGTSLPDNIFNVSMKPLFEDKMPTKTSDASTAKPLSPEIKVLNMSSSDECIRKDHKMKKPDKSLVKKIEIAVQTEATDPVEKTSPLDKTSPAENKSVQVELSQEDVHMPQSDRDTIERMPHPIEPKITIVTPETDNSSNDSTSSESGMIIEIDKKEIIVTPKKKKNSMRISKRPSPRIYQKIRSTSISSKATSPMKRFSRIQSGSRSTPQKKTKCLDTPDTATRRVDIHMSESAQVDDETDPSQETRVSIDASAESSQTISGLNDQDQEGKPYRVRTRTKRWIRMKDTSDTSTSFASPPPIKPKSIFDALANVTPILEMLDSPGPRELRRLQDISPVSTPETPSPRTMMMPSNIPHRDKISRMLRFSLNNSQTNDSTVISSTQRDQSTLTDSLDVCQKSEASKYIPAVSQPSKVCICKNPQCKLLHIKFDDIHDYALKNCPEILQKYEDLQNLCTERIASLTDLIEKVRNEQKDMDLSLISPSDDTSLLQLSTPKPARNDVQAVRRLIDSIEEIHAQLARTLLESQRIMQGSEEILKDETLCDAEIQAITSTPRSKLVDTIKAHVQESKVVEGKAKPKIISNDKVNIQFNRFKMQQKPQAMSATKMLERNSWPPCTLPLHEEEIIKKLSKEILEQSKNLDKESTAFATSKENNEIQQKASPFKDLNLKKSASLEHEKDSSLTKEFAFVPETTKENDFIPILTGIPKILRNHGNVTSISARPKPPVTLLNGLYRPELESSGHELSTIVEFDTTDTVNKNSKSPAKFKPSLHVAPLPVQQNQNSSKKPADSLSNIKHSVEKLSFAQKSQETICNSPEKLKSMADCITETKTDAEREYMVEKCNKQLQCNTTEELVSQTKDKLGSSISTDLNNPNKESKHKMTSTSVYSFSGLSGISEITSSPSSDVLKHTSSPEEMEIALKKLGLGWAVTTLKKTREASALSSSSNSDVTPINTARRMISPTKKQHGSNGFPDISDVSSISIKEASKSTEQAVLLKGRTSTPKFQNSNSNSERSSTTNTSESVQDPSDSLTVPNVSLTKTKSDNKQLQNL